MEANLRYAFLIGRRVPYFFDKGKKERVSDTIDAEQPQGPPLLPQRSKGKEGVKVADLHHPRRAGKPGRCPGAHEGHWPEEVHVFAVDCGCVLRMALLAEAIRVKPGVQTATIA